MIVKTNMETKNTEVIRCIECREEFKKRKKGTNVSRLQPNTMGSKRKTCCEGCRRKYRDRPQAERKKMNELRNSPPD